MNNNLTMVLLLIILLAVVGGLFLIYVTLKKQIDATNEQLAKNNETLQANSEEIKKTGEDMKSVGTLMQAQKEMNASQDRAINSLNLQMTEINKGIGQVTGVTDSVASLSKVLTQVKTRGILGEYQAEGILREVLADNQYEKNIDTAGTGKGQVEFAIKVPGEDGGSVYLPLDSKFPLDAYQQLVEAKEGANQQIIEKTRNQLKRRLSDEAKDIKSKYVAPPRTTSYALMFLPVESLYFEVLDMGMFEELQREYGVIVVGPTSLSALLSSIETGYRAIAFEAHSDEVWKTLAAVKTEFMKFYDELTRAEKNLQTAANTLNNLIGPRTNMMMKKLDEVTELSSEESEEMFGKLKEPEITTYDDGE